ncbi:hypothetical protein ACOMHN_040990 [Nucella lapillus]
MASTMIVQTSIFVSAILLVSGLYEDQAGTYDWKQDYVGKVTNILWESVSHGGSGKKVFVATERNIIASLNTHDGSIAWRQVSEEDARGNINALLYNGNHMITVQAGGKFVRSWHAPTGNLHWEAFLASDNSMSAPAMFLNEDRDSVIVATSESLVSLKTSDGKKEWERALPDGDTVQRWYITVQTDGDIVAVGVSPGLRVTVVTVGPDGKVKKTPRKLPAQWVQKNTRQNLLSPFDNATTVMAGVPESSARLACDFVIAGTSLHSPSETLDSLVDDDICKHLRRCFFPGRGRPPALPKVQLTNRLLLQLKLLQAEGKKSSKDVSKWFDMLFPDVSYPSTRLSGALDRLEKKVQAVQREDGDIDSFLKTEVDFDFVSSSLSKADANVAASQCGKVISIVGQHLFNVDLKEEDLPKLQTCINIADEGHFLAKFQATETILAADNVTLHTDGTSRGAHKIVGQQITLDSGATLYLGLNTVATEDSETLLEVTIQMLQELSDVYAAEETNDRKEEVFNAFLTKLTSCMSDRAAVMKLFSTKLSDFLQSTLGQEVTLHFLKCNAHFLLGLSRSCETSLKTLEEEMTEQLGRKLGRDTHQKFQRFRGNERATAQVIRLASSLLGPRGDEKNGCRAEWLAFLKNKSLLTSYRSGSCQVVGGVAFVCYTADTTSLQFLALEDGQVFKLFPFTELGGSLKPTEDTGLEAVASEPGSPSSLLLLRLSRTHMALLSVSDAGVMVQRDLPKVEAADVSYEGDSKVLLIVQRADPETVEFTGLDLNTMTEQTDISQRISLLANHGAVEKMFPMLFRKKKDGRLGAKVLMVTQDFALHCAHKAGKAPWHREEALAYIVGVEMVDLPVSENEAKFEDEFGSSRDDIFAMFVKRIKVQLSQLKGFVTHVIQKVLGQHHHQSIISKSDAGDVNDDDDDDNDDDDELVRDAFSLHKMIVAVTAAGKVYGMRSHNGKTTAHFPHAPQCAVLGLSKATGNGLLFTFNPVTGAVVPNTPPAGLDLGYKVIQAQLLHDLPDENFLKGLLLIDSKVKVHFFPESFRAVVERQNRKMFLHLTDIDAGLMKGYWLLSRPQGLVAENVWSIDLQGGQQRVTGVYTKRPIEHVHSQGRVLGDRSVLYKYLNPNLVVVVAEGEEASLASSAKGPSGFFNVYLVDAVTGHIVFHENHKRTRGPINIVHAENWVVYSFYSEKHRRYEMASYIFPVPIHCMASSVTEKGITNKNIIMALRVGGVLSLPKALLDPRRPSIPSQETMEEGTIPYIPELPVSTENFINYNHSIFNVRGIHTAPAGLESTSLVLVYGTDIFCTRVMPSKMFDVLKEDFDYLFIAGVLAIMIFVSVISQKLAARKALKRAWK